MDIHIIAFLENSKNLHFEEFLPTFASQLHQTQYENDDEDEEDGDDDDDNE